MMCIDLFILPIYDLQVYSSPESEKSLKLHYGWHIYCELIYKFLTCDISLSRSLKIIINIFSFV
jgi:hypothetical protein